MPQQQLLPLMRVPTILDALNLIRKLENLSVPFGDAGYGQYQVWITNDWVITANSRMVIRQPAHIFKGINPALVLRSHRAEGLAADPARFADWVAKTIKERKTNVNDWFTVDYFLSAPLEFLQLSEYCMSFLVPLSHLPDIRVAEDKQTRLLHFLFDGGQGFVTQQPIWTQQA